ncbi:universal stress protein [Amycolatopsis aidingensis]|uniref:universal stress protein n=1 Tax=Amycolatopsis aidingensis TaxID=2842453 RepID=UPI001C0BD164|nr:universal stress protein [Amycolatopsis aidingensis]
MSGTSLGAVVVGVDGSDSAMQAVRWAAAEAARRNRELRLVHALDDAPAAYYLPSPMREDLRADLRQRGEALLATAHAVAREAVPGLSPRVELREGRVAEALREATESAALLVLGTEGLRPLGRMLVGSASVALAAHAACPVVLVRAHVGDEQPPVSGPVVVGVDGSPAGEQAIAIAFEEASLRGAPLVAVHVWDETFLAAVFEQTRLRMDLPAVEERAWELLAERLAGWQEKYPDVTVHRELRRGAPADELLAMADRALLLVVGSRGRGGLAGLLLGSTSQAVMSYALCPVIVARGTTDQHGLRQERETKR